MAQQHIPLHCSGITSALKSNIPFATKWGRQRGHLCFIRVHISFICSGRCCPALCVWGGNCTASASPPLPLHSIHLQGFLCSLHLCYSCISVLHFPVFNHFLSYLWSVFPAGPILPLTEDVSLSLGLDFAIPSVSVMELCMLRCLFTPCSQGRLALRGI